MLTKIQTGFWIDLSKISTFFINPDEKNASWLIDGYPSTSNIEVGEIIEKKLEEYYGVNNDKL